MKISLKIFVIIGSSESISILDRHKHFFRIASKYFLVIDSFFATLYNAMR
ncbi:hypothetical protein LSO9J_80032 [Candidatus Liberibacter solanacearum]